MGYSKKKKEKHKSKGHFDFYAKLKTRWVQKRPILFFVFGFGFLLILFYAFWQSDFFDKNIQPAIVSVNALLSSGILNLFGQNSHASRGIIYSPAYSISVHRGCDAIEAMALFLSTTLAFPLNWKIKIKGLFAGIILLFVINLVRIVTLFFSGVYFPGAFEILHTQLWPVAIIIIATILWIFLIRIDTRKKVHVSN